MALINCPECNKEVSDKATACIHCGYPLGSSDLKENLDYFFMYEITNSSLGSLSHRKDWCITGKVINCNIKSGDYVDIYNAEDFKIYFGKVDIVNNLDSMLVTISNPNATNIEMMKDKCTVIFRNLNESVLKDAKYVLAEDKPKPSNLAIKEELQKKSSTDNSIKCPKCGSTQIQAVPRKWSLTTGLLTNQVDRVCLNCKHKF